MLLTAFPSVIPESNIDLYKHFIELRYNVY